MISSLPLESCTTPRTGRGSYDQEYLSPSPSEAETWFHMIVVPLDRPEPSVRRSLTRLFRTAGYETISYGVAAEFLDRLEPCETPCCLVADLRMPGLSGLDLQEALARRHAPMALVFISGRADVESGVRAMKAGAVDFLEKPVDDTDLLDAVSRALERDRERRAAEGRRSALLIRLRTLTPREREVFGLVVTGLLNKQVGAELGASEKTIKVHRARVMQKMEAQSLADLVRMADCIGLVDSASAAAFGREASQEPQPIRHAHAPS